MEEAKQAETESPLIACAREGAALWAYCESRFPVGKSRARMHSVTGELYAELACGWDESFATAEAARLAAQDHFNKYAQDRTGALYWHAPPDIAFGKKQRKYVYFMRLLISEKPPIPTKES